MSGYIDWLKKREGYSAKPYWDYKQWSVGHGTRASGPNDVIDQAEAVRRLNAEVKKASDFVQSRFPNVDAGTKAALSDLTYNAGTKWADSGLGRAIAVGDLETARGLFRQYNRAGGQVNRGLVSRRNDSANWIGGQGPDGDAPFQIADATQGSPENAPTAAPLASGSSVVGQGEQPAGTPQLGGSAPFAASPAQSKSFGTLFSENLTKMMTENANKPTPPPDTGLLQRAIATEDERRKKFALSPFELARRA